MIINFSKEFNYHIISLNFRQYLISVLTHRKKKTQQPD